MTKKHFKILAEMMAELHYMNRLKHLDPVVFDIIEKHLKKTNPDFDANKFIEAVGNYSSDLQDAANMTE